MTDEHVLTRFAQPKTKFPAKNKGKAKCSREEDIPPSEVDEETTSQLKAYQQLDSALRCETHHGHCYVDRQGGHDTHRRLNHGEMSLWSKKIVSTFSTI